jgi:hypothetical protein
MAGRRRKRLRPGVRVKRGKLQAFIRVAPGPGGVVYKTFDRADDAGADAWLADQERVKAPGPRSLTPGGITLRGAVHAYLKRIAARPCHAQHQCALRVWILELGADRSPHRVPTHELDEVMQRWLRPGPPPALILCPDGRRRRPAARCGVSKDVIRGRRSALLSFYRVMYPKRPNPVRETHAFTPAKPGAPRCTDYATIARILAAMSPVRFTRAGQAQPALSKLRAAVMAYTGWPPATLKQWLRAYRKDPRVLQRTHTPPMASVPAREKGDGAEPREVPLAPLAVDAIVALLAAPGGTGDRWHTKVVNEAVKAAARAAGITQRLTLYAFRHSFGTDIYRRTRDTGTTGRLLLHADGSRITARYTKGAHAAVDAAAVQAFGAAVTPAGPPPPLPPRRGVPRTGYSPAAATSAIARPLQKLPRKLPAKRQVPSAATR